MVPIRRNGPQVVCVLAARWRFACYYKCNIRWNRDKDPGAIAMFKLVGCAEAHISIRLYCTYTA